MAMQIIGEDGFDNMDCLVECDRRKPIVESILRDQMINESLITICEINVFCFTCHVGIAAPSVSPQMTPVHRYPQVEALQYVAS